jgi:hypothetical protein
VAAPVRDGVSAAANSVQRALGLSKQANKNAKKALTAARRADRNAKSALAKGGPAGPAGDKGPPGDPGAKGATGDKGADGDPVTTANFATNAGNADLLDGLDSTAFERSSLFGGGSSGGGDSPGNAGDCRLGDVWLVAENFAPINTHFADGALFPTPDHAPDNEALFSLLGTTYGGDGQDTFALPDLRDAAPNSAPGTTPVSYVICVDGTFPPRP